MSNLQDVPLAEPENIPTTEQNATGNKTNSLKRFFKLGKKSNSSQDINADASEMLEDESNKDPSKHKSISRFLTRLKGTSKPGDLPNTDPTEPTSSVQIVAEEAVEKPVPNAKPTLKTSISTYWKLLFHRQKAANRQGVDSEQDSELPSEQQMDMNEIQQIQQEQQTDPIQMEDACTVTPATSRHDLKNSTIMPQKLDELQAGNCIPQILEEVQVLTVSDEIVDPSLDETIQH